MKRRASKEDSMLSLHTSWGTLEVCAREGRVRACRLPVLAALPRKPFSCGAARVRALSPRDQDVLNSAEQFLRACFQGAQVQPPPVALPEGSSFVRRVWRALQGIPRGQTRTYGALALALHQPRAARAVGRACGANPLPLFIPCHRVVSAGGALGGFSSGWPWKLLLLEREGALGSGELAHPAGPFRRRAPKPDEKGMQKTLTLTGRRTA